MPTPATRTTRVLNLAEKAILGFIAGAAAAIAIVEAVFLVGRILRIAGPGPTTLTGVPLAGALPADLGESAALVSAEYESVTLVVEGLSDAGRAALIAAAVVASLVTIGICAALAWLCLRVFVGRPFVRSATWGIAVVSILMIVAGLGGPALHGIANAEAAAQLDLDSLPVLLVGVDLAPLGWAFALAVVGAAFEIGQRLQRDTQGLV